MNKMEVKTIKLPKYDWEITVFYDYICRYMEDVMDELEYIGCGDDTLKRAYKNLSTCSYNNGLTFSNNLGHKSVIVIGRTDSAKEFEKTWTHELGHAKDHISKTYGISPHGEEIQYLGDYIIDKMWNTAKKYLCDCCRKEKDKKMNIFKLNKALSSDRPLNAMYKLISDKQKKNFLEFAKQWGISEEKLNEILKSEGK